MKTLRLDIIHVRILLNERHKILHITIDRAEKFVSCLLDTCL